MKVEFVQHLPDLITEQDYQDPSDIKKVRIRIQTDAAGVEVLGDSMYPKELEAVLNELGPEVLERVLCG